MCVFSVSGVNIERLIMNNIEECRDLPRSTATRLQKDPIRAAGGFNGTHILWLAFAFESVSRTRNIWLACHILWLAFAFESVSRTRNIWLACHILWLAFAFESVSRTRNIWLSHPVAGLHLRVRE